MDPRDPGVIELLQSSVQPFSWSFQDLIGQQREWTPTTLPRTLTSGDTVMPLDDVILVDCSASAVTMTLETAIGCAGRQHTFKKIDSSTNAMTLDGNGSETIDGTASFAYTVQNISVTLKSDGANWRRVANSMQFDAGRYTPALTNVANISVTASAAVCQFLQIGNFVGVSGRVNVKPAALTTSTQLGISLPVPSDFAVQGDLAGTAFCRDIQQGGAVRADTANDRAQLQFLANDTADQVMFFIFGYWVI